MTPFTMVQATTIRTVIVDDEARERDALRRFLNADRDVAIVGECGSVAEAAGLLSQCPTDLLLLDVEMPDGDGFGLLSRLPVPPPAVVFVTAHDRYAARAFEAQAFDYLVKPLDHERFGRMLSRAKQQLRRERQDAMFLELQRLVGEIRSREEYVERLLVRNAERSFFVPTRDVDWIEAQANYVRIHTGSQSHLLRESIGTIERRLDPRRFRRIHRSAIVNLDRIQELQPWFHGEYRLLLKGGAELRVSRTYRKNVAEAERA